MHISGKQRVVPSNLMKLALLQVILLLPVCVTAELIRIDVAGFIVEEQETRPGYITSSSLDTPIAIGDPYSGYLIYSTESPVSYCGVQPDGSEVCDYNDGPVVEGAFTMGGLTTGQPNQFPPGSDVPSLSEATVADKKVGSMYLDYDELAFGWGSFPPNEVDFYISLAQIELRDSTGAAVTDNFLPTEIDFGSFNFAHMLFYIGGPLPDRRGRLVGEITDFSITSVPEPGTLALLGVGLAGMGLVRRRRALA